MFDPRASGEPALDDGDRGRLLRGWSDGGGGPVSDPCGLVVRKGSLSRDAHRGKCPTGMLTFSRYHICPDVIVTVRSC